MMGHKAARQGLCEKLGRGLQEVSARLCVAAYLMGRAADEVAKGNSPMADLGMALANLAAADEGLDVIVTDVRMDEEVNRQKGEVT